MTQNKIINSAIAIGLIGTGILGISFSTEAQDTVDKAQNQALQVVAKMTEGQRTYYQTNQKFHPTVEDLKKDFTITLPSSFDYAIRTTSEAAYSYVIPATSPQMLKLKAYVGVAFVTPNQDPKITTIICQNTTPGQVRPADPILVRGTTPDTINKLTVQCGQFSVQVPASEVNQ